MRITLIIAIMRTNLFALMKMFHLRFPTTGNYNLNIEYLSLCIKYYIESLKTAAKGLIPGISRDDILNLILPLPSETYQISVVNRVNELFEIIEYIEKNLK